MEAGGLAGVDSFGRRQFGDCDLGDMRRTERLVHTADRMLAHPGGTLPDKLNRTADLVGFYRLANRPEVTHGKLMAAHAARTRELIGASAGSTVLVIHDTTEVDFSGLDVDGLGQIGLRRAQSSRNGGGRGFLCHGSTELAEVNSLAYDFDSSQTLGLVGQLVRVRRKVPKKETPKQKRDHPRRESRLTSASSVEPWKDGWRECGDLPADKVVHVADRTSTSSVESGSDLLEFVEAVHAAGGRYVIRSKSNRNVHLSQDGAVTKAKLHEFARSLPDSGIRVVDVPSAAGRFGAPRPDMTVKDFFMALAKLGGHLNRKHDGHPGWLVLWRGWTKLQQLVEALQMLRDARCV